MFQENQSLINFIQDWLADFGNQYETSIGYPYDWQIRRQAVLIRDNFTCQSCKENLQFEYNYSSNWLNDFTKNIDSGNNRLKIGYVCAGAHIHHIKRKGLGGTHNLDNLVLLCESCHRKQPGHFNLPKSVNIKNYFHTYTEKNSIKKARVLHKCDICEQQIKIGDLYYGGSYLRKPRTRYPIAIKTQICISCSIRFDRRAKRLLVEHQ